jgi:hypothetical protein
MKNVTSASSFLHREIPASLMFASIIVVGVNLANPENDTFENVLNNQFKTTATNLKLEMQLVLVCLVT